MTIVIDPGSSAGVTIHGRGPIACAVYKQATVGQILALLAWGKTEGETELVVEGQHAPRDPKRFNFTSLQTLMQGAHRWTTIGEMLDYTIARPIANSWQSKMFKVAPEKDEAGKKLTTKQRSKLVAVRTWDTVIRWTPAKDGEPFANPLEGKRVTADKLPHDICDSAVMGRWWGLYGSKK